MYQERLKYIVGKGSSTRCGVPGTYFSQRVFVSTSTCCSSVPACKTLTFPLRFNSRIKGSFTSICLLFYTLLGLCAIAFCALVIAKSIYSYATKLWRKEHQNISLVNNTSLDSSHRATYSTSHVAVVAHICVLLFQLMAVSFKRPATPDNT